MQNIINHLNYEYKLLCNDVKLSTPYFNIKIQTGFDSIDFEDINNEKYLQKLYKYIDIFYNKMVKIENCELRNFLKLTEQNDNLKNNVIAYVIIAIHYYKNYQQGIYNYTEEDLKIKNTYIYDIFYEYFSQKMNDIKIHRNKKSKEFICSSKF